MSYISEITLKNFKKGKPYAVLANLLEKYRKPSFGSMSKRDVDIMMFEAMQELGIIDDKNPQIYDVMQLLHVTRSKARNLIYEVALRKAENEEELKKQLREYLDSPLLLKETDKVLLEIDNPLVIDYLRNELKRLKHLTDGSFSPELVKMDLNAFVDIYTEVMSEKEKKQIKKELIAFGVKKDDSVQAILLNGLKKGIPALASIFGGRVAERLSDGVIDFVINAYKNAKEEKEEVK